MIPGNLLSTGIQIEIYCPAGKNGIPGVPELAYQPPSPRSLRRRTGEFLIQMGQRLAKVESSQVQWVKELT